MKTSIKAIFTFAVLALAAFAAVAVVSDDSDAAVTTLTINGTPQYDSGYLIIFVNEDVDGKEFSGNIDTAAVVGLGTVLLDSNVILIETAEPADGAVITLTCTNDNNIIVPEITYTKQVASEYTVTFVADGNIVGSAIVAAGETVADADVPAVPEVPGKEFKYWTLNGVEYNFATPVNSNITLVAYYVDVEPEYVTVTFVDGSEIITTETLESGEVATAPAAPEKTGYTFQYWTLNGVEYDFATPVTEDITLAAFWKAVTPTPEEPIEMKDLEVGGIAVQKTEPTVYDVNQRVNVVSDWTLTNGAIVYIYGQLVVPAGLTVTVEAGAQLILSNDTEDFVVADIKGTLVIEESEEKVDAGYVDVAAGTVSVSGAIEIAGDMDILGGELVIEKDSKAIVEETGVLFATSNIIVKEGAVLQIDGEAEFLFLAIYGTVVFDSEVASEGGFVFLMADGALLKIEKFTTTAGFLAITDGQLVLNSYKDKETKKTVDVTVADIDRTNSIVLYAESTGADVVAQLTDITIVEKVTSKSGKTTDAGYVESAKKVFTNTIDISGTIDVDSEYIGTAADAPEDMNATALVGIIGTAGITVTDKVTVGDKVSFVNAGVLKVTGTIDASAEEASFLNLNGTYTVDEESFTVAGTISISDAGEIVVYKNQISDKKGIDAAFYKVESDKKTYYHYVTIDAALTLVNKEGNTVEKIDVIGSNTLNASNTVPKDVTLNLNEGSKVKVGASNGADVTLTIAKGADLKGTGTVDVKGTMYAEDKGDIVSTVKIQADVYSEQVDEDGKAVKGGWAKWTNLNTALDNAVAGDIINVYRDAGNVEINANTTIKTGVTLVVADGKAPILIKNGVTLTIDGTLQTAEDVFAETRFATTAMNVTDGQKTSTVIVNGYLITDAESKYADSAAQELSAGAPIAGVYYETEDGFAISTLENAIAILDKVVSEDLTVFGPVTAGDVTFTATDLCENIIVSSAIVKDIDGKDIKTTLKIASLTLVGSELQAYAAVTGTVKVADAAVVFDKVIGAVVTDDDKLLLTGSVSAGDITVSAGKVTSTEALYAGAKVDVTVSAELVSEGANIENLYITGTVTVESTKMLRAGVVTVLENGVLSVAPATSTQSPGIANIAVLQVGIDYIEFVKDTGAAATVNGPVKISQGAIVLNGAVLDDAAKASLADIDATEYYVEDALWITIYDVTGTVTVGAVDKIPVENAYFTGDWNDVNGKDICAAFVGDKGAEKAYAVIEYNVYNITVLANEGVDDVFIDGILMAHGTSNSHFAVVKAGTHEITYKLANGYTGTAKLYVDGKVQSGMTFTTSGTPETSEGIDYTLQISGIEKSGFVPESPDAPAEEKDEGLALTDILLIVLVILAAILVIVVAIRMMRS